MTVSALRKLKEWLTLHEAAEELSAGLGEPVADVDVLRLAIDGHVKLSVYLPSKVTARCQRIDDPAIDPQEQDKKIQGLCDIPMFGRAKLQVEHNYHWAKFHKFTPIDGPIGALVEQGEWICVLPPDPGESGFSPRPQSEFPRGSQICVRRMVVEEFVRAHSTSAPVAAPAGSQEPSPAVDKPLGERERATLLTIIAALAEAAEIDASKPSKAATAIEALTARLGARVSARSIEDHLKRIPEALERKGGSRS